MTLSLCSTKVDNYLNLYAKNLKYQHFKPVISIKWLFKFVHVCYELIMVFWSRKTGIKLRYLFFPKFYEIYGCLITTEIEFLFTYSFFSPKESSSFLFRNIYLLTILNTDMLKNILKDYISPLIHDTELNWRELKCLKY